MVGTIRTKKIPITNKMADDSSVFSVQDVNIVQAVSDVERIMRETIAALDLEDAAEQVIEGVAETLLKLPASPELSQSPVTVPNVPELPPGPLHKEVVEKLVNDIDPPEVKPEPVKPDSPLVRLVKLVDQACAPSFWCKPPKKILTSTP